MNNIEIKNNCDFQEFLSVLNQHNAIQVIEIYQRSPREYCLLDNKNFELGLGFFSGGLLTILMVLLVTPVEQYKILLSSFPFIIITYMPILFGIFSLFIGKKQHKKQKQKYQETKASLVALKNYFYQPDNMKKLFQYLLSNSSLYDKFETPGFTEKRVEAMFSAAQTGQEDEQIKALINILSLLKQEAVYKQKKQTAEELASFVAASSKVQESSLGVNAYIEPILNLKQDPPLYMYQK